MVTNTISNRVNRSLRSGHLVIGPVLFPAVSSRKRPAQALHWLSITKRCSLILLTRFNGCASEYKANNSLVVNETPRRRHLDRYILCGDFNARCGSLDADCEGLPSRKVIDVVKNSQGETFVDFLSSVNMAVVNGRKGQDAFTCIYSKGCSVVDYCIVGVDNFELIDNFKVLTMSECVEGMQCRGDISRIPITL